MITLEQYWMGRDVEYSKELTPEITANAQETVRKVNQLLSMYQGHVGKVSSGWRPKSINDATKNSGKSSNHLIGQAVDIQDLNRELAAWCVLHTNELALCGLWIEDPRYTPTWTHFQSVPPKSGKRIYIPSASAPKATALPGQRPIPMMIK